MARSDEILKEFLDENGMLPAERLSDAVEALQKEASVLGQQGFQIHPMEALSLLEQHLASVSTFLAEMLVDQRKEIAEMWNFLRKVHGGAAKEDDYDSSHENIPVAFALDRMRRIVDFMSQKKNQKSGLLVAEKQIPKNIIQGG